MTKTEFLSPPRGATCRSLELNSITYNQNMFRRKEAMTVHATITDTPNKSPVTLLYSLLKISGQNFYELTSVPSPVSGENTIESPCHRITLMG